MTSEEFESAMSVRCAGTVWTNEARAFVGEVLDALAAAEAARERIERIADGCEAFGAGFMLDAAKMAERLRRALAAPPRTTPPLDFTCSLCKTAHPAEQDCPSAPTPGFPNGPPRTTPPEPVTPEDVAESDGKRIGYGAEDMLPNTAQEIAAWMNRHRKEPKVRAAPAPRPPADESAFDAWIRTPEARRVFLKIPPSSAPPMTCVECGQDYGTYEDERGPVCRACWAAPARASRP